VPFVNIEKHCNALKNIGNIKILPTFAKKLYTANYLKIFPTIDLSSVRYLFIRKPKAPESQTRINGVTNIIEKVFLSL
jgi:hypothetical protein